MNLSLLIFIIGMVLIIFGYAHEISPNRDEKREIEFVPRNVYDELSNSHII